jgi:hypothetical protein
MIPRLWIAAALFLFGAATGGALTARLYRPQAPQQEAHEPPQIIQGGFVAERNAAAPLAPIPPQYNRARILRQEQISLQPETPPPGEAPKPIRLTVTEVTADHGARVVISDPEHARIIGAVDIPAAPLPAPSAPPRWSLGALYDGHQAGAYLVRSFGAVEIQAQAFKNRVTIGAGVRF